MAKRDLFLSAYWISTLYAAVIGKKKRTGLGAFFTPPDLSALVVEEVFKHMDKDPLSCSFADICCGGGALLAPVARELIARMERAGLESKEIVSRLQSSLTGVEIDPFLLFLTRAFLVAELDAHIQASGVRPGFRLLQGDALMMDAGETPFDIIVGNPPYKTLASNEHKRLKTAYGHVMEGNSNLYPAFLEKSFQMVKEDGLVSVIIPTSLYSSKNFGQLRRRITESGHVASIVWLADRKGVFHEVLQEVSILTVNHPGQNTGGATVIRSLEKGFESNFSTNVPARRGRSPWPIPKDRDQLEVLSLAQRSPFRLADYGFTVRIGPLVYNRDHRRRYLRLPKNGLERGVFPIVFPFQITNGGNFDFNEKRDTKRKRFVHVGKDTNIATRHPSVVMKRTSPAGQRRLLKCGTVPNWVLEEFGGYVGENHVVVFEQDGQHDPVSPETLATIFNSDPVNLTYRCFAGTVSVSCYNLLNLPLPDPGVVSRLLQEGLSSRQAVLKGYGA